MTPVTGDGGFPHQKRVGTLNDTQDTTWEKWLLAFSLTG